MLRKLLTTLLALLICFSFASCKKNKGNHEFMTFLEKDGGRIGLLDEQVLFEKGKASSKLDLFILEKKEDGFHYDSPDVKLIFQEEELRLLERSLQSYLGQVKDSSDARYDNIKLELSSLSRALLEADSPIVAESQDLLDEEKSPAPGSALELELVEDEGNDTQVSEIQESLGEIVLDLDTEGLDETFKVAEGELKYPDYDPHIPLEYFEPAEGQEAEVDLETFETMEDAKSFADAKKVLMQKDFLLREVTCNDGSVRWGVFWY